LYGNDNYNAPSRFINEVPAELMVEVRPRAHITQTIHRPEPIQTVKQRISGESNDGLNVGQRVKHSKFGEGVVLDLEGQGKSARAQVKFERSGSKWLVVAYANLTKIG
jgi:DNA helicase-2/ATP-dependent DNA helicase PcrA